jgi:cytochrome b pre-mRNA-processing protein 3
MLRLFRRTRQDDSIDTLYGAIVAQSRLAAFYGAYGVPDTVDGRFDLIVLHVFLLYRRLKDEAPPLRALGQGVFDRFCRDMDENLREMGVSDLGLPRAMQRMGNAFYGRAAVYDKALADESDDALAEALGRNVLGGTAAPGAPLLAAYVREAWRELTAQEARLFTGGRVQFPHPATISRAMTG